MFETALRQAQVAAREARHEDVLDCCAAARRAAESAPIAAEPLSEVWFLEADALRYLGRWDDAAAAFAEVCRLGDAAEVKPRACRAYRLLSEIRRRSRDFEAALAHAQQAIDLAVELGDPMGELCSRVPLARVYSDLGRSDDAERLLNRVLREAETRLSDPSDRALVIVAARTVLSLLHFRQQHISEAMQTLAEVRELAETVVHPITLAAYHRQVAILHEVQQTFSAAIRNLHIALELYDQVRFESGRYDVYWSLSLSYTDLGDLRTARLCLVQCAAIAERLGMRIELGKSKSSFAELEVREGDYEAAIALFRDDLEISRNLQDLQALGHCNRKLADCYRLMADFNLAEQHARASIDYFEQMSRESEANAVRVLLSRILVEQGRLAEAEVELERARQLSGERARQKDRAAFLRVQALLDQWHGDLDQAGDRFAECLRLMDDAHPSRELASAFYEAGLVARERDDIDLAKQYLRRAIETAGELGSRDLWQQAVDELWQIDLSDAQRLMLTPYLPGRAVDELSSGEAPGRLAVATVMFVDMRGSTDLSGNLSPLELSEVVSAFLGPVVRIIMRWQGSVDKFIGDCVLAVFGLSSDDNGAESAIRAGLEIIEYMEATKQIRARTGASILEATIGINTGEVVAGCFGPLLRRDYTVLGYHVNLAQRLQSVAGNVASELGTRMVVSDSARAALTWPLPATAIDLTDQKLKGINSDDVTAWLVQAEQALDDLARPPKPRS